MLTLNGETNIQETDIGFWDLKRLKIFYLEYGAHNATSVEKNRGWGKGRK